jgi:hypothetical protein
MTHARGTRKFRDDTRAAASVSDTEWEHSNYRAVMCGSELRRARQVPASASPGCGHR